MDATLKNPDMLDESSVEYLTDMWYSASVFGIHIGWFVLAIALLVLYFWPQIQNKLDKSYVERQNKEYDAKCKKNPDWVLSRQQAMEAARLKMQEELSKKAKEHAEKEKEKEEKKRQELVESLDNDIGGHTLGTSSTGNDKKKNNFRPEYHPLMGSGPSATYRPPRRSCCPSGGGCG